MNNANTETLDLSNLYDEVLEAIDPLYNAVQAAELLLTKLEQPLCSCHGC